jgi:hypothetical protein
MVEMPVRVKPPPADTGDTISPGCASLDSATPLNGARMTVLSKSVCCTAICRSATATCCCAAWIRASTESTSAWAWSTSAWVDRLSFTSCSRRFSVSLASAARTSLSRTARRAASAWAFASSRAASGWASSSRARTWPSRTAMPSSTFTSITLPVTFEETVARRRAVT